MLDRTFKDLCSARGLTTPKSKEVQTDRFQTDGSPGIGRVGERCPVDTLTIYSTKDNARQRKSLFSLLA